MIGLPYLLFFCSGASGLIYQVVWVRLFGNIFGNTFTSASLVVAVFMLGLGLGGYLVGRWADGRYLRRPESLLAAYAWVELAIGLLGLGVSVVLPRLGDVAALVSSYRRTAAGWYALSVSSQMAQLGIAAVLLTPITLLMGGTLTLLIRHLVRYRLEVERRRIAVLYGVNTAGAALGALATDLALVPMLALHGTQAAAAGLNGVAAGGAFLLVARERRRRHQVASRPRDSALAPSASGRPSELRSAARAPGAPEVMMAATAAGTALALAGFAGMGMELLWFRHVSVVLGQFRAVFAMLLAVILAGIAVGSLAASEIERRGVDPVRGWALVQGLFVAVVLGSLLIADGRAIDEVVRAEYRAALGGRSLSEAGPAWWAELWFNGRPILLEVGLPAVLMGFGFPLGNAIVQRVHTEIGRRAGLLYLSNTAGAVCGALATGFVLLPRAGLQSTAAILAAVAGGAVLPLLLLSRADRSATRARIRWAGASLLLSATALALWQRLPPTFLLDRALGRADPAGRRLALQESITEIVEVVETADGVRWLLTNGHPMSSTTKLAQRYMRALAHVPLLCSERPTSVLVIGFGVGNTAHAAALHPTVERIEVAELSPAILARADDFREANGGVLGDPRVVVFVNDGRHHLRLRPPGAFDLVTLEPPPVGYAGVGALYSREFYELARSRLKPGGYLSQWLPAYQVPAASTLALVRAFIEVFPQAVLLSGAEADLLLVGVNGPRIEIDPERVSEHLAARPAVRADLERLDLGRVHEIVGMFVASPARLAEATRGVAPVTDDRPLQEYSVRSLLEFGEGVPAEVVDLSEVGAWCPRCFSAGEPVPLVEDLKPYLALLDLAYRAPVDDVVRVRRRLGRGGPRLLGSAYLGAIVPDSAGRHAIVGLALAARGALDEAIHEFEQALALEPTSEIHWHLGAALAQRGAIAAAETHLRRAVELDPANTRARYDLASLLLTAGRLDDAIAQLRQAVAAAPTFAEAYERLGVALSARGELDEAASAFRRALALQPDLAGARAGLARLLERQPRRGQKGRP